MPTTIVRCSVPGCEHEATAKIAAPWTYGRFAEQKTYGYACPDHIDEVLARVRSRRRPPRLDAGETLGTIEAYEM